MRAALLLLAAIAGADDPPPDPVRIYVAASPGQVIPQSRGGGGFQRTFRFRMAPGRAGCWIRQVLEVRGTVFDAEGQTRPAHLDVIEYYRVRWDARPESGSRTQPSGEIDVGTWQAEAPQQDGHTRAADRSRPIPPLVRRE